MFWHVLLSCCGQLFNAHGGALSKEHPERTLEGEKCACAHSLRVGKVANGCFQGGFAVFLLRRPSTSDNDKRREGFADVMNRFPRL